ncbi:hypothetical protein [Paenibacillus hubeiensis]|uniref:hypothetical protein n=1 Tax=Paenibacillus hubeiensis TaxID=3077330 RepID=UPI0031BA9917
MKTTRFVKVLLLSSALLMMAAPTYAASSQKVSNTVSATFTVKPVTPSFVLKWVGDDELLDTLSPQTVNSGDSRNVTVRAITSQVYTNVELKFTITRTDGTTMQNGDVELAEYVEDSLGNAETGNVNGIGDLVIFSDFYPSISTPGQDFKYNLKFNTAGEYVIKVVAIKVPS